MAKQKFRHKPTEIEAEQWFEGTNEFEGTHAEGVQHGYIDLERVGFYVVTIHGGKAHVVDGDWIITEPDGIHHYPCKPDIFAKDYDLIAAVEELPESVLRVGYDAEGKSMFHDFSMVTDDRNSEG